jgi:hypothetical protein
MAFAQVKSVYKREKLRLLVEGRPFEHNRVVHQAFAAVSRENVQNYVEHCEKHLKEAA